MYSTDAHSDTPSVPATGKTFKSLTTPVTSCVFLELISIKKEILGRERRQDHWSDIITSYFLLLLFPMKSSLVSSVKSKKLLKLVRWLIGKDSGHHTGQFGLDS